MRCGCGGVGATGAAMESTNCVGVTGAGTALDPFTVDLVLDGAADNLLTCGVGGLYARAPQMTEGDESIILDPGAGLGDYIIRARIDTDTSHFEGINLLGLRTTGDGGLGVDSYGLTGLEGINAGFWDNDGVLVGSGIGDPSDVFVKIIGGTQIVVLDVNGNGTVTFPRAFPNNLIAFTPVNGDANTPAFAVALGGVPALGSHQIHCEPIDPTDPVASTNVRITYIAIGT